MKKIAKISGIYQILSVNSGKIYIGQSKNIYQRWAEHRRRLRNNKHENEYLQNIYNKHGKENLHFSILESCEDNKDEREAFHLNQINESLRINLGYVRGHWKMTPELRKKFSEAAKKRGISPETRAKIKEACKGRIPWNKGIKTGKQSEELILKRANSNRGQKRTEETKLKMSKAMTGIKKTKKN